MHNKVQLIHRWGAVAVVAMLGACSSTPQVADDEGKAASAAAASAAAAPAVAGNATAAAPVAAVAKTDAAKPVAKKRAGYKTRQRGGQTMYCRKETLLGTNIADELCFTEAQLDEIDRRNQDVNQELRQSMGHHICADNCSH